MMSPPQRPNNNPGGGGVGGVGNARTASSGRTPNAAPPSNGGGPMKMIGASSADACATIVNSLMHHRYRCVRYIYNLSCI